MYDMLAIEWPESAPEFISINDFAYESAQIRSLPLTDHMTVMLDILNDHFYDTRSLTFEAYVDMLYASEADLCEMLLIIDRIPADYSDDFAYELTAQLCQTSVFEPDDFIGLLIQAEFAIELEGAQCDTFVNDFYNIYSDPFDPEMLLAECLEDFEW